MGKPSVDTSVDEFKVGDLVWAKLEGFTPWPAKIVEPPPNIPKPKKGNENGHCVFFFGTNNYNYIKLHSLKPYLQFKAALSKTNKTSSFRNAITQIDKYLEQREKRGVDFDPMELVISESDVEFNKLSNQASSSTPKERKKKEKPEGGAVKRRHTEGSVLGRPKKSRILTSKEELNSTTGSSPSKTTGSSPRKGYHHLLDRPGLMSRPDTPPLDLHSIPSDIADKVVEPSKLVFGFLGCGAIGSCIIKNLKVSGHNMVVWNRSTDKLKSLVEELGVTTVQTPQDVIAQADITFSCVSDPVAAKNIVFGNCGVLMADLTNKGYVEMTGIDSETSQDIAEAINSAGGRYLEAQLIGNRSQAEYGTMIIVAAGDPIVFKDCFSCFKVIARHSYHLKEIGHACKMSLVFNLITGITIAGLAEGLALADRAGIEQSDIQKILSNTRLACPEILEKCDHIISDPYVKNFPLKHMQKYLKLALNMADPMEQSLPLTATTNEIYKHTKRLGYSDFDVSSVYFRERTAAYSMRRKPHSNDMICIDSLDYAEASTTSDVDTSVAETTAKTVEENGVESHNVTETLDEVNINNGTVEEPDSCKDGAEVVSEEVVVESKKVEDKNASTIAEEW